jgi:hypothetical protein
VGIDPDKVLADVEKTGFPTELRVAAQLRNRGWSVSHNVYFMDKDEVKGREVDISAGSVEMCTTKKPEISVYNELLIEVKQSKSYPWVIFSSPKDVLDAGGYSLLHWKKRVSSGMLTAQSIEAKRPGARSERIGRSSYRAMTKSDTATIAEAILSATKAAIHACDECDEQYSDNSYDIVFFTPVVIVDGELFDCFVDQNDELSIHKCEYMSFRQIYMSDKYEERGFNVDIVTQDKFPEYLIAQETWIRSIFKNLEAWVAKYHK